MSVIDPSVVNKINEIARHYTDAVMDVVTETTDQADLLSTLIGIMHLFGEEIEWINNIKFVGEAWTHKEIPDDPVRLLREKIQSVIIDANESRRTLAETRTQLEAMVKAKNDAVESNSIITLNSNQLGLELERLQKELTTIDNTMKDLRQENNQLKFASATCEHKLNACKTSKFDLETRYTTSHLSVKSYLARNSRLDLMNKQLTTKNREMKERFKLETDENTERMNIFTGEWYDCSKLASNAISYFED